MIFAALSFHRPLAAGISPARVLVLAGFAVVGLVGCQRPEPARTYFAFRPGPPERPTTGPAGNPSALASLRISRVRLSAPYESRAFQYRTGPAEFTPTYYDVWADDPGALLSDELARRLEEQRVWSIVVDEASPAVGLEMLDVRCRELYADVTDPANPRAVVTLRATLLDPAGRIKTTADFTRSEKTDSSSPAAMVGGWARGIQVIAEEIGRRFR